MNDINENLISASQEGDVQKAIFAIASGANVNYIDEEGRTPLMYAAYNGFDQIIVLLLAEDVDLNVVS
ncbi:MAG: ankyrin repeat domain-containing protein, partial [Candidatus Helarchaeota archaeon]